MTSFENSVQQRLDELDEAAGAEYLLDIFDCMRQYQADCDTGTHRPRSLYNQYEHCLNGTLPAERCPYACAGCGSVSLLETGSDVVCEACGHCTRVIDNSVECSTHDQVQYTTKYEYKRTNHFKEWLDNYQGRESMLVSDEHLDLIAGEFRKHKWTDANDVTAARVRVFLRKLRLPRLYEHTQQIIARLTGRHRSLTPEQEHQLLLHFEMIQEPFETVKPSHRKNFPSYSYILHQLCVLLGYDHLTQDFELLKSRTKLHELDVLWREICRENGWRFHSTV